VLDQPIRDPKGERGGEHLALTTRVDPKEVVLDAGICRAHDHFVTLGDHILDRPFLLDRPDGAK
jgi:hypothetical protein